MHHDLIPSSGNVVEVAKSVGLFVLTALAEIVGCYMAWLVVKLGRPLWLLIPAAAMLALFAWLLTLSPACSRARVRRLRWRLCGGGGWLDLAGGRNAARSLGSDWQRGGNRGHGLDLFRTARIGPIQLRPTIDPLRLGASALVEA